ncbi:hypothetical protein NP493_201g01010 [Ridgeia piscesae]|uniref:Uncharacterized protein n=1 Tax=Ridgeia piscesae TaxID=27915 RepID=A0AAD9P1F7_RIDPI|nr:hypothetical protein NP493_201g01010 [Ridgeia piscesae]
MASAKDDISKDGEPGSDSGPQESTVTASLASAAGPSVTDRVRPGAKTKISDAAKTKTASAQSRSMSSQAAMTSKSHSLDSPASCRTVARATSTGGPKNHGSASDLWKSIKKGGQKLLPGRSSYRTPAPTSRGERKFRKILAVAPLALHKMVQGHAAGEGAEREGASRAPGVAGGKTRLRKKKVCLVHVDGCRYKIEH